MRSDGLVHPFRSHPHSRSSAPAFDFYVDFGTMLLLSGWISSQLRLSIPPPILVRILRLSMRSEGLRACCLTQVRWRNSQPISPSYRPIFEDSLLHGPLPPSESGPVPALLVSWCLGFWCVACTSDTSSTCLCAWMLLGILSMTLNCPKPSSAGR